MDNLILQDVNLQIEISEPTEALVTEILYQSF